MNRADAVKAIVWLDQVAARAKLEAAAIRAAIEADAKAELAEQGTAPTWRLPDLGTVALSVSHEAVVVADEDAFTKWVAERYPTEVVQVLRVRPAWRAGFLDRAGAYPAAVGELVAVDPETGEIVPGLVVRPGGQPVGITIRPSTEAKQVYAAVAERSLKRLALDAGPAVPTVLAELGGEEMAAAHRLAEAEPVGHLTPEEVG